MNQEQLQVLLVDDDPVALAVLRDQLAGQGYVLHEATDWTSVNDVVFRERIAVIVLDVNLPGLPGDKLAEILGRNIKPRPRVILHSGLPAKELRRKAVAVGATNWLEKGAPDRKLVSVVRAAAVEWAGDTVDGGSMPPPPGSMPPRPSMPPRQIPLGAAATSPPRAAPAAPGPAGRSESEPGTLARRALAARFAAGGSSGDS